MSLLNTAIEHIRPADAALRMAACKRIAGLTMPHWALGALCDLAVELCAMTVTLAPPVSRKAVAVFAGDHGVTDEGVSLSPKDVTGQMVRNFLSGGAGINVLSRLAGARLVVVDVGVAADLSGLDEFQQLWRAPVASGTANLALGPAMSREEAVRSLEIGIRVALALVDGVQRGREALTRAENDCFPASAEAEAEKDEGETGADILAAGEMGIGNTTPSSAITVCLTGATAAEVTGRGSGIDDAMWARKVSVVERALVVNRPDRSDPLDILAKVGGFEIGAMAGFMLGAAARRRPVVLDGFISTAGALLARELCPASVDYMIAGHRSVEPGHRKAHEKLNKRALLDLGLRLGEGTGAALAFPLVEAAGRILTEMATFSDASVEFYHGKTE